MYELWFRKAYCQELRSQMLRAAIRPGNRKHPNKKGAVVNQVARIRIIDTPGSEVENIQPTFLNFESLARITELTVKKIGELEWSDLQYCSDDSKTIEQVKLHLQSIYHQLFTDEDQITVVHWEYLQEKEIYELDQSVA